LIQAAKSRRKAALKYEKQSGNQGAVAMIDTDFGSDIVSCPEANMTDDTKKRQQAAGVGKGANMAVGYQWRNINVSSSSPL